MNDIWQAKNGCVSRRNEDSELYGKNISEIIVFFSITPWPLCVDIVTELEGCAYQSCIGLLIEHIFFDLSYGDKAGFIDELLGHYYDKIDGGMRPDKTTAAIIRRAACSFIDIDKHQYDGATFHPVRDSAMSIIDSVCKSLSVYGM